MDRAELASVELPVSLWETAFEGLLEAALLRVSEGEPEEAVEIVERIVPAVAAGVGAMI